jgi:hypothetical protein
VYSVCLLPARAHLVFLSSPANWVLQWPKQLNAPLEEVDPEIADIIELEKARQWKVSASRQSPIATIKLVLLLFSSEHY